MTEIITSEDSSMSISCENIYGQLVFKQGNQTLFINVKDIPEMVKSMMDGIKYYS